MSDNELIAEFMGLPLTKELPRWNTKGDPEPLVIPFMRWKYHESWDHLMPVVEKITNIWVTTTNRKRLKECTPTFRALQNRLSLLEISGVYELSVEFIKWYNQQGVVNSKNYVLRIKRI